MKGVPEGPFFVPKFAIKSGGLDFLGMRQATLDLRDNCFPGFSNSTQHLRPFSLMCWIYWKLYALADEAGLESISSDLAKQFREKAEVLFTWGHRLNNVAGLPGITAKPPTETGDVDDVSLTFKAWRRIPNSTGLMAAVNYGPALKTTSGFGFLNPVAHELFQPISIGVELAKALDENLQKHGLPMCLKSLIVDRGSSLDAEIGLKGWDIRNPGEREKRAFRSIFFDGGGDHVEAENSDLFMRSATFELVLAALASSSRPLSVEDVRERMFSGEHAYPGIVLSSRARSARIRWILLQVRQAQRLAMESLLSWVEKRILYDGDKSSTDLVKAAAELCTASQHFQQEDWLRFAQNRIGQDFEDLEAAVGSSAEQEEMSIFFRMNVLIGLVRAESDETLPQALSLLGLCREYASLLKKVPELEASLDYGGGEGLSLSLWNEICRRADGSALEEFLLMLIEEHVLSRHFAVATRRYDGNVIRLRVTVGDYGLEALVPRPWRPLPAQDKLASGLSLLADCGLIGREGSSYVSF